VLKKTFFFICLCSFCIKTTAVAQSQLKIALAALAKDSLMRHAAWSFRAVNLQTGEVLAEKDADMSLVTASNMKIVTTAAALKGLGANTRLSTNVYADAMLQNHFFTGRIVIMGGGDPSFCSQYTKKTMTIDSLGSIFLKILKKHFPN
jgi:serine-type D-Ala-D-Ala carboxypeptidase/endopeptidase (penicillin-binding protein 4)